jgi:hypothetical protein
MERQEEKPYICLDFFRLFLAEFSQVLLFLLDE